MTDWNWDLMLANFLKVISWLLIGSLVIITFMPASGRPVTGLQHHLEHFAAFALTGLIFGFAYAWQLRTLLLSAFVFTLLLELGQVPLPTRHARLEDFIVDAAGACLAILVVQFARRLARDWVGAVP
jgi:VanZ family protein